MLLRGVRDEEVAGSNPVTPTMFDLVSGNSGLYGAVPVADAPQGRAAQRSVFLLPKTMGPLKVRSGDPAPVGPGGHVTVDPSHDPVPVESVQGGPESVHDSAFTGDRFDVLLAVSLRHLPALPRICD